MITAKTLLGDSRWRSHDRMTRRAALLLAAVAANTMALTAGCASTQGSSGDVGSAADIPDNLVFVPFTPPGGVFTVSVPQGWARADIGTATEFTDKFNSVRMQVLARPTAPTVDSVNAEELPAIAADTAGYAPGAVTVVQRHAGPAVLVTYQVPSAPSSVTGKTVTKTVTEAVQRYEFWRAGNEVVLTLSGPQGADNVDAWRRISDSLYWR
ncbi:hypothetical protein OG563_40950 [Nocardia vinacea]|uniref:Lipoprotein LpqN n=1 Tax=Nocardia vinacea TaxID=96468 RepID=A0ABZ1YUI5_9NOCA|nr:hypothetical protein [Nocardia vinacea]